MIKYKKRYRFWIKQEGVEQEFYIHLSSQYDNDDIQGYLENWVFNLGGFDESACRYGFEVVPEKLDVYAILMGRFQPFHKEHLNLITRISNEYTKIILCIGEQQDGDQLAYYERATLINGEIQNMFDHVAIMPMYDFVGDDEAWGADVLERCLEVADEPSNMCIIKPRKNGDIDGNGNHYLDMFDFMMQTDNVKIGNHDIHATAIRENPEKNISLVVDSFKPLVYNHIGQPYPKEFVRATRFGEPDDWIILNTFNRIERVPYVYAHRKNKDSVAFIFFNTKTKKYGIIIEQKPPIGSMKTLSAFGGSFDNPTDNPYRILRQEAWEEAGIKEYNPVYIGSYMATTQSDEIQHLFVLETEETEFNPQTTDVGEIGNIQLWVDGNDRDIPDWRVTLCRTLYKR